MGSSRRRLVIRLIVPFVLEQRPDDTGILVGESYRDDVRVAPPDQSRKPALCITDFTLGHANHRSCAVNEQRAQIGVTAFTDAQQRGLAPSGVLPGD